MNVPVTVERLRLDRTVGLGLVITVLLQSGGAMMWAGSANARIAELEGEMEVAFRVNERLSRIEGQTSVMRQSLARIEEALHSDD